MKPIDRLKVFIEHKQLSLNNFDKSIGRTRGYIATTIRNKGSIGTDILTNILRNYPDLDVHWLLTGEGEMIREGFTKPKTIDELIEEKIEAKLRGVTIEDLKTLMMVKEFSEAQKLEAKKAMEKEQAKQK